MGANRLSIISNISKYGGQVRQTLRPKSSKRIIALVSVGYIIFYFWATNILVFRSSTDVFLRISENWSELLFRERAPFNWEPVGILSLGPVQLFLAVPNILFGIMVSLLIGINLAISYYTYKYRTLCRINPSQSMALSVPSLLTGIACCGPSILLSLGIASVAGTVALVSLLPFLLPLALTGLVLSIAWSGYRLEKAESSNESEKGIDVTKVTIE